MILRLVTEDPEKYLSSARRTIVFATGDGSNETRVCKGFTEKFDGDRVIFLTFKSPLPHRSTGLASLAAVRTYIDKFDVKRLVWSCDKEHLASQNDWVAQVTNTLMSLGMNANAAVTWNDAARFSVVLGPKNALLWCAFTGIQVNLEENLSRLIQLEYGLAVAPDKPTVHSFLSSRGLTIDELIRRSSATSLKHAFSSLFSVFEDIERS
jgi:hypothetical protein